MTARRDSLQQALREIEDGALAGVSAIVVSRAWWDSLSRQERDDYHRRCEQRGVELRADNRLSQHYVEVMTGPVEPPMSSERQL